MVANPFRIKVKLIKYKNLKAFYITLRRILSNDSESKSRDFMLFNSDSWNLETVYILKF